MNAKVHHRWLQEYRHTQCWSSLASSEHYLNRSTWAPNTPAYLCDHHATQGLKITVSLVPTATHEIETQVSSPGGGSVSRHTPIRKPAED